MKATIVIPTFNRAERLRSLLACLVRQEGDRLAKVIVCDDGSPDHTREVVQSFMTQLDLEYYFQENLGFRAGQARNMGIRHAVGDVIVFVDDDVVFAPDFVAQHVAAHKVANVPTVVIGYRHRAHRFDREVPDPDEIRRGELDDRVAFLGEDGLPVVEHATPWVFVYSCNFSCPRTAKELYFDEDFEGWGMEDTELGYRLVRSGLPVVAAPKARVLHIEDPAPRDPFRCEERELPPQYDTYVRNAVYFMDKFPDDPKLREFIRNDIRWYVLDKKTGALVKNGYENNPDVVIDACRMMRRERKSA